MKRDIQKTLVSACQYGTRDEITAALEPFFCDSKAWREGARKFATFLETGIPQFSVIQLDGNSKLPFAKFSSAPGVTCPGAGECLNFCYSFRAWRFALPFFIHCQNTLLLRSAEGREQIASAFLSLKEGSTFRLYVDGDFDSLETLRFWFGLISLRPDVSVYGYSKSWELFLSHHDSGGVFPANYALNLSSGSKYGAAWLERMKALPCVRGEFIAVRIPKEAAAPIGARTVEYNRAVREAAGKRVFVCPGLCGSCTTKGHGCGLPSFKGVSIAIGVH